MKFNAENFEPVPVPGCPNMMRHKNTILVGGLSARWFALGRSPSGNLTITPEDFKLNIISMSAEQSDKRWYFTNYSNAQVFHGLVSDLVIYDRLLSPEGFGAIPLKP